MSLATGRAELVRSVLEGVALNTRWMNQATEKFTKRRFEHLNFVGGGARSPLWCQILADVLDRPIRQVADPVLANVRGAAFSASVALGHLQWDDIPSRIEIVETYPARPGQPGHLRPAVRHVRRPVQEEQGPLRQAQPPGARQGATHP